MDAAPAASATNTVATAETNSMPYFDVERYVVEDNALLPTNIWVPILSKYTGPNVSLDEIVKAATDLQTEYRNRGYPFMSVAVAQEQITNGIVTLNVFQTAIPQVVISGIRYYCPTNAGITLPAIAPVLVPQTPVATTLTNAPPPSLLPTNPPTLEQLAQARKSLLQKLNEPEVVDNRIHVVSTNAGPHFDVERYRITGNTILSPQDLSMVLTNIDGAYGTNVSIDGIRTVVEELQKAYKDRGYVTVAVGLPQQKLTNAVVKVRIIEGRLVAIDVEGNRYFSSNNVMRALPSLHTNIILNANVLQAELNRANANQDRQIYPVISPGPYPGTSELALHVKDQLPVHGKLIFNNQNTPGTPQLRINASAVEDNLWQLEHSLGVQYGFSPENYKSGNQWNFYDQPLVANYSTFYRLPIGPPESVESTIENKPGTFGYNEATRQFNLPPPTTQPTLTVYASRATIDTGIENLENSTLFDIPDVRILSRQEFQEGLTINDDVGFQLSKPLPQMGDISSTVAGGLDLKEFYQANYQTNNFVDEEFTENAFHHLTERTSTIAVATPATQQLLDYLPLQLSYNASENDFLGPATFGVTMSVNLWFSSSELHFPAIATTNRLGNLAGRKSLDAITGSSASTGHWIILKPSFSQNIVEFNNWTTLFRLDGQWSSEPLISSEQFGIGGVNSVRGYHEGEIFGDTGWHVSLEEDTPPHIVGVVGNGQPLTIQGIFYTDGADAYLLDPQGGPASTRLWSAGFGLDASVGTHWQAQFLFSLPLVSTALVSKYDPYFNFAITAQF
ncbi:MAG TPA: POTRA domain-containing protein [Candidatus Saccharimonadales bacterium]|nr:POTRA domain-containing protein [Candidatus Saccharimonadales bacterium]